MTEIIIVVRLGIVMHRVYPLGVQVNTKQAIARRTHQQVIFILLEHIVHTSWALIRELKPHKLIVGTIIVAKTCSTACPECTPAVDEQRNNIVAIDGGWIILIVQIVVKTITVVLVQSVLCTNPDITSDILGDLSNLITRQLISSIEMLCLAPTHET